MEVLILKINAKTIFSI